MNNPLRASWEKSYDSMEKLFDEKSLVERMTKGISDEVVIIPLSNKKLLVTVYIINNAEYWDKELTQILGEKIDYCDDYGYTEISDEEY